jgi:uncharacterized membrane protein YhhN
LFLKDVCSKVKIMGQDLAHKRPFLLASLAFGISYPLAAYLPVPGFLAVLWKMAGVALLVPYALRRHHQAEFMMLAVILGLCSLGDGLIEESLQLGAVAFAVAHATSIWLYSRHRRVKPAFSQSLLALTILIGVPVIAYLLPADRALALPVAVYSLFLSAMAAMAWSSNFPRYRVGMGAVLFVISDLLIFAEQGPLAGWKPVGLLIWYLYYFGVLMIAVGVAQTLVKRGHYPSGEEAD